MKHYFPILVFIILSTFSVKLLSILAGTPNHPYLQIILQICVIMIGAILVLKKAADIIEETTEVLSERTKLASGLLQSFGTAFPDMALGVVAALISLKAAPTDPLSAIQYAIVAAATTFGSNIYNIGHAVWCLSRQNLANLLNYPVLMFPGIKAGGELKPLNQHIRIPTIGEINQTTSAIHALSVLTGFVAMAMVIFGKVDISYEGDLYQLVRPAGLVILLLSSYILYHYRHNHSDPLPSHEVAIAEKSYRHTPTWFIAINLIVAGICILVAAESMVHAIVTISQLSHLPVVIAGVISGVIGCLGEMIVIHNYSVNPKGRLGDAVMGVAMDNIVTTLGASIVALMGGIFLGGNALILIFVIILTLNTTLIWQLSKLHPYLKT